MSAFRKVNVSHAELNKNPYKNEAKSRDQNTVSENKENTASANQEFDPDKTAKVTDAGPKDPQQNSFDNASEEEAPPGNPVNDPDFKEDKEEDAEHMSVDENVSHDEPGINLDEWYFPQGDLPWINY